MQLEAPSIRSELIDRLRGLAKPLTPEPTGETPTLEPLKNIRAVLFDVYGTLFISGSGDLNAQAAAGGTAMAEALAAAGFELLRPEAGPRAEELWRKTIQAHHALRKVGGSIHPEVEIRAVAHETLVSLARGKVVRGPLTPAAVSRLVVEYEGRANPVWPMPGGRETLAALRGAGLQLGLVSNAQFYTPLLFPALWGREAGELGFAPELCVWSYEAAESKPSPRLFPQILARLREKHGITPAQTVYVGNDLRNDVWTAQREGCRTVLFAGDARSLRRRESDPECRDVRPDRIVTALDQLLGMLI